MAWNPNYDKILIDRHERLKRTRTNKYLWPVLKAHYSKLEPQSCIDFINHWCITFDPRNMPPTPKLLPFILFPRQEEFIHFILECLIEKEPGLVEKCRDVGATWLGCAISVWLWLFHPGTTIGWGSLLARNIDDRGNPKSIFLKIRQIIENLPIFMLPEGFNAREHMPMMKIIHPTDTASIIGEGGENVGRGGRTTIYWKDEAQPLTANILTPDGWDIMGNMKVGSKIIGIDGKQKNVIAINNAGVHKVYKVTFSDGSFTECSENHLWTVESVMGKRKIQTLRTSELLNNIVYNSPKGQNHYRYRIPICKPIEFFSKNDFPLHPYLVGALLGDDRGRMGWKWKSRARQAVLDSGIAGMRSSDKFIPKPYLFASIENRIALLQGLMDTDGSAANGGSASFHTSSEQLAKDVRFLTESLGGVATYNIKVDKRGYKNQYVLHLALPDNIIPFRLSRKIKAFDKRKHPPMRTILSIEHIGNKPVKCITIDSEDGLYLTDNCIVTHNSAHYEQPELIEAALGDNTDVPIDISSVNGTNNVFYSKRMAGEIWYPGCKIAHGITRVFIFSWEQNPSKTLQWHETRRARAEREGLLHIFMQEVERNYSASVDRLIIPPEWVIASIDAHKVLGFGGGAKIAGQDVADEGSDKNALVIRHGVICRYAEHWGGDAGIAAQVAIPVCMEWGVTELYFDSIGVGAGFKVGVNNLKERVDDKGRSTFPQHLRVYPWNAGASPLDPDYHIIPGDFQSPTNEDQYANLKAQSWFRMRSRFYKTYRAVRFGETFNHAELISLDSTMPRLQELKNELSQPQYKSAQNGKTMVDKKPNGSKSPNLADAFVIAYSPCREVSILDVI